MPAAMNNQRSALSDASKKHPAYSGYSAFPSGVRHFQKNIPPEDNLTSDDPDNMVSCNYKSQNITITYFFEEAHVDEKALEEEINKLKSSIERREKLLSNENYVNKAPANIVELDRKKLAEEKEKLEKLLK